MKQRLGQTKLAPADLVGRSLGRFQRSVSLVSWVYNEKDLVRDFVARAHTLMSDTVQDFEIIVVNDGSTDGTGEILQELSQEYDELKVIHFQSNQGIGEAAHRAISSATKEFLFWQTADWSYDISDLRYFLELTNCYDVVSGVRRSPVSSGTPWSIAKRAKAHFEKRSDNLKKAFVSVCNYLVVRLLFNFPMSDYQNITIYPTPLIQSIRMEARSSFGNPEFLMKSFWKGASIIEVPIAFIPRCKGEAKGTRIGSIAKSVSDILKLWVRWILVERLPFKNKQGQIRRLIPAEWSLKQRSVNEADEVKLRRQKAAV